MSHPILFWAGANTALTCVLLIIGPGNIFPSVIGIGAVLTFVAIVFASMAGMAIRAIIELIRRALPV
jgi:hypothetical protein